MHEKILLYLHHIFDEKFLMIRLFEKYPVIFTGFFLHI